MATLILIETLNIVQSLSFQELLTTSKILPPLPISGLQLEDSVDYDQYRIPSRLSLNSQEVDSVGSSDVSPMLAEAPSFMSITPEQPFIKKLPRSSSSTSRNLKSVTPQMVKKHISTIPPPKESMQNRGRSSSSHSLHASVKRVNSNEKPKLQSEATTRSRTTPKLPPKFPIKPPTYPVKTEKVVDKKPKNGVMEYETFINSHKSTLNVIATRKTGIKRIKAIMKARHANEGKYL